MNGARMVQGKSLEYLAEVELQYRPGMSPLTSSDGRMGKYLGSGDGTVRSSRFQGTVRWDIYERTGEKRCETNIAGVIETDDGAEIQFDTKGYGMVPDRGKPDRWSMVAGLQFDTSDKRYDWLNRTLAVWVGEFDMGTFRHRYHAYAHLMGS